MLTRTRITLAGWPLVFLAISLPAQTPADSSIMFAQPAMTVSATRLMPRTVATMGSVHRLDGWSIRRLDGRTLDAVLEQEGGLFIRDIGGGAGVKTVSLRNAPATQTVIHLNGMRLNNPQNSLVDLGLYPAALFDAVEIVRGGQSSLFGADANAGAIVLGVWPSMTDRLSVGGQWGSFGEAGGNLRWDQAGPSAATSVRFGLDRSDGNFPYDWTDGSGTRRRTREGASHERWHAAASAVVHGMSWGHIEATVLAVSAERGSPGLVTSGPATPARLRDQVAHAVLRAVHDGPLRNSWEAGVSASVQDETYETLTDAITPPDRYVNRVLAGWAQRRITIADELVAGAGMELSTSDLEGFAFADGTRRFSGGVTASVEWTQPTTGFKATSMMRWDMMSDRRPSFGPRVAFEMPVSPDGSLVVRGSVGSGVRTPNYNELYWRPGGEPSLRPERVATAEAGLRFQAPSEPRATVAVQGFVADTRDRITGWPPVNLPRTLSWGTDANAEWRWSGHRWWMNGTLALVESVSPAAPGRQVPYLPRWIASSGADLQWEALTVTPVVRYVSRRFTTLDNVESLSLPPTTRVALVIRTTMRMYEMTIALAGSVEDLFDVGGVTVPGFPLPGRSLSLRATIEIDRPQSDRSTTP